MAKNIFARLYDALLDRNPNPINLFVEQAYQDINGMLLGTGKDKITIYNPDVLVSNKGMQVIDKMRRDSQVKVALNFKKHSILSTGWTIQSPEGMDEEWDVKEFVEEEIDNVPGTFTRKLKNILSALDYGFSATEPLWRKRPDGKIGYKNFKTKKPHDFWFDVDPYGNIKTLKQLGIELDPSRFILYSYSDEFENPYGQSDLTAAYVPWWLKDNAYKFLAIMLERLGIPPIFASYNTAAFTKGSDRTAIQNMLKDMQAGSVATIPRGENKDDIVFWSPELAGQASQVFMPALSHADMDIAKALLLPGLIGGTSDRQEGSYARSQVHFDMYMLVIEAHRNELAETIVQEQIIKPLVDLNFAVDEYPKFQFNPLESKDVAKLFSTWAELVKQTIVSKQPADEAYIREQLEMPPINDEEAAQSILSSGPLGGQGGGNNAPGGNSGGLSPKPAGGQASNPGQNISFSQGDLTRKPLPEEASMNFAEIDNALNGLADSAVTQLKKAYTEIRDKMVTYVRRYWEDTSKDVVKGIDIRGSSQVQNAMGEMLQRSFDAGRKHVRQELGGKYAQDPVSGFTPAEAQDYLNAKKVTSVTTTNQRILGQVRTALLTALRGQQTTGQAMNAVDQIFAPLIGPDPSYAETVVRTNMIDAYNQGRLTMMRSPEVADYISGVLYSAILDQRTTEICRHLDKSIFKLDDPALDRLTPPNHFNCRSVLVPVMIDEPADAFITSEDSGKAIDMAGNFA